MAQRALAAMDDWLKETAQAAAKLDFSDSDPPLEKVIAP
jgi:hypothetical protein